MERCPHYFTVDVEDYFHSEDPDVAGWDRHELRVERSTRAVIEACARARVRATFFVLGWVAERCPALVREIAAAGHTVASHGYEHRFIYQQSPAEFRDDIRRAKDLLESLTGTPVLGYRAPYFSIISRSLWAYDVLHAAGYRYSSSVFPGSNPRYGIPGHTQQPVTVRTASGGTMREIPITTFGSRIGCGGVYFRALPYPLFASLLDGNGRRGIHSVFYIHPWELDTGKPAADGSLGLKLRHAVGVRGAASRLERLLRDFAFQPIEAALEAPAAAATPPEPVHA